MGNSIMFFLMIGQATLMDQTDYTPANSGGNYLINFKSKVNPGSDKAFILFQHESSTSPGTGNEDLRLTIGVFNDFRHSATHSDELWLQGRGRLVQNIGSWDSDLNSIIGIPNSGTLGGYEWRINNVLKMTLDNSGYLLLRKNGTTSKLMFSAQTNDPAEIRHIENNNAAQF